MTPSDWIKETLVSIEALCVRQRFLTADDVWDENARRAIPKPTDHNDMALALTAAKKSRKIRRTDRAVNSRNPSRRRSTLTVWESRLYVDAQPAQESS